MGAVFVSLTEFCLLFTLRILILTGRTERNNFSLSRNLAPVPFSFGCEFAIAISHQRRNCEFQMRLKEKIECNCNI